MGCCCCKADENKDRKNIIYTYNPQVIQQYNTKNTPKFYPEIKRAYVINVYDGDTITIAAPVLNVYDNAVFKFSVRIYGIDCPELKSNNNNEREIALKAKEFAEETLLHKHIILENLAYDKYGRLLANVIVGNTNYKDLLLRNRLAYEYFGKTKSPPSNWKKYYENNIIS